MTLSDIARQLKTASLYWILIGIVLFTFSNFMGSFQWFLLLRARNIEISFGKTVSFYYVGLFFNNFLPGYVAGDAFRIYDISKSSGKSPDAVSTVFFDRFVGFIVLTSLALIAGLIWLRYIRSTAVIMTILLILTGWIAILIILFNNRLARKFKTLLSLFLPENFIRRLQDIYQSTSAFRNQKKLLLTITLTSVIVQSLRILVHYAAARATHNSQIDLFYFFVFIPIVALAVSFPVSIGGFGVREQSAVNLFCLTGVGGSPKGVTAMEFMAYLIGIISSLAGGIVFVLRKKHQSQQDEEITEPSITPELAK